MIKLKYKTRENTSPQGKPRVYFCCHPEDFSKYFETVANEVLEKQNCTIWYVDEDTSRDDEFFGDLKQMQLFVMPVTTNLLCSPNVALDSEFKFAVENHIPVLPLMQENGLEKLFNEKCGDLQFLDKCQRSALVEHLNKTRETKCGFQVRKILFSASKQIEGINKNFEDSLSCFK